MSPPSREGNSTPNPPVISIRQAVAEEAHPLLTNMINDAFRHYHAQYAKDLETAERVTSDGKQVASMMETPCNAFLVAEEVKDDASKSVVGCVHVCWSGETHSKDEDVDAEFGMLSVPQECSRRGIGKLLVSAAEERCRKELGRDNIVVEISVMSPRSSDPSPQPVGISTRQAVAEEAQLLTNVINDVRRPFYSRQHRKESGFKTVERVTPDGTEVASIMETPCNSFLVAEEVKDDASKTVVGCVHVCWSGKTYNEDGDADVQFSMLSVPREYSGRGIGRLLVSAAEDRCRKELGRENIVVEISIVTFRTELFGWYEAQGYRKQKIIIDGCGLELQLMTKTIP
eukprot:g15665.t1